MMPLCSQQQVHRAEEVDRSPTQISDDTLPLRWRGARAGAQFASNNLRLAMAQKMTDPVTCERGY